MDILYLLWSSCQLVYNSRTRSPCSMEVGPQVKKTLFSRGLGMCFDTLLKGQGFLKCLVPNSVLPICFGAQDAVLSWSPCSDLLSSLHHHCLHSHSPLLPAADPKCLIISDSSSIWAWAASSMHLHFLSVPLLGWLLPQNQKNSQTPLKINTLLFVLKKVLGELFCGFHFALFICEDLMVNYCTAFLKCSIFPAHLFLFNCTTVGYITHCK